MTLDWRRDIGRAGKRAGRACARIAACLSLAAALGACGGYLGTARPVSPAALTSDPGWTLIQGVPLVLQESERDCGVAVASMVVRYWTDDAPAAARPVSADDVPANGLTARQIAELLEVDSLEAFVVEGQVADLQREIAAGRPVIVGLAKPYRGEVLLHYEVVVGVHRKTLDIVTLDPAHGWRRNSVRGFALEWNETGNVMIVAGPISRSSAVFDGGWRRSLPVARSPLAENEWGSCHGDPNHD